MFKTFNQMESELASLLTAYDEGEATDKDLYDFLIELRDSLDLIRRS